MSGGRVRKRNRVAADNRECRSLTITGSMPFRWLERRSSSATRSPAGFHVGTAPWPYQAAALEAVQLLHLVPGPEVERGLGLLDRLCDADPPCWTWAPPAVQTGYIGNKTVWVHG